MSLRSCPADVSGRSVLTCDASSLDDLARELAIIGKHFVLLVAADTTVFAGPTIVAYAERLIRSGATYVCCWGPGCSRFHDAFDEADLSVNGESTDDRFVFTTWHEDEALEEAAWFALNSTFPARAYEDTRVVVLASVDNAGWADALSGYLARGAPLLDEA